MSGTCKRCGEPFGAQPIPRVSFDYLGLANEAPVPPFCSSYCDDADRRENPARLAANVEPGRLRHPEPHFEDDGLRVSGGPGLRAPVLCPFGFDDLPEYTRLCPPPPLMEGQVLFHTQRDRLDGRPQVSQTFVAIRLPKRGALEWFCTDRVTHHQPIGDFILFPKETV